MRRWHGYFKEAARQEAAKGKAARRRDALVVKSAEGRSLYAEHMRSQVPSQIGVMAVRPVRFPGERVDDPPETINPDEQAAFDAESEALEKNKDEAARGISGVVLGSGETPSQMLQ